MSIIQIRKARREGARLFIVVSGWTGSGKTVTAIHLGYGLANFDPNKLGFLDCENRRGSLNADALKGATVPTDEPFLIADLHPPFSPDRYIKAIHEFQQAGIEVLIVDSGSHEWEGTGGCQEIADANKGMWNKAKGEHKRFMNALLQTDMHIIVCVRAREKDKPEKVMVEGREKTVYQNLGLQPIQEKNFMFEATASLMLYEEGTRQVGIKVPGALRAVLGRGTGYITADDGKAIRDWVGGASQLDPKVEAWRNRLLSNTEGGVAHIEECWSKVPGDIRTALGEQFHSTLTESAKGYDQLKAEAAASDGQTVPQTDAANAIAAVAAAGASARASATAAGSTPAANASAPAAAAATPAAAVPDAPPAAQPAQQQKPATAAQPKPAATGANRTPTPAQGANRTPRPANHAAPAAPAITRTEPVKPPRQIASSDPKNKAPLF